MGTSYKATVQVRCWKQHTCVACGSVFGYLFERKKTGQGGTEEAASAAAHNAAVKAVAQEVNLHACPQCGTVQPEMVGAIRARAHWWILGIGAGALALVIL